MYTVFLIKIIGYVILIRICFKLFSNLEKLFVKKVSDPMIIYETLSLRIFKYLINFMCIAAPFELIVFGWKYNPELLVAALFLIGIGIFLRISAIIALGEDWNYNVVTYKKQRVVRSGIYHYFRHPAYIGNIYIVGVFMLFGAYKVAILSAILLVIFYMYRSKLENRILQCQLV